MDFEKSLKELTSPDIESVFWTPHLIGSGSAWWAHIPFAFWIMSALRPRLFVELGVHNGVSYSAFCEANARAQIGARCYGVDTWAGDEHAGTYSDEVYNALRAFHDENYSAFSELVRCTFDEALPTFQDHSIDLIHIDGLHTYEAVKHDFESWLPKLSDRGVVLFHDTNVRKDDFGVYRLFAELSTQYPSFEFLHGYGLGLIVVGEGVPEAVRTLCAIDDPQAIGALRQRFSHLGARWHVTTREQLGVASLEAERDKLAAKLGDLSKVQSRSEEHLAELRRTIEKYRGEADAQVQSRSEEHLAELRRTIEKYRGEADALKRRYSAQNFAPDVETRKLSISGKLKQFFSKVAARTGGAKPEKDIHAEAIASSIYFDREWYLEQYPDVAAEGLDPVLHFLLHGGEEGRDPGPLFSVKRYLQHNPDVEDFGNPFLHYVLHGEKEGRSLGLDQPERSFPLVSKLGGTSIASQRAGEPSILYVSGEPDTPGNTYRVTNYIEAAAANGLTARWISYRDLPTHLDDLSNYDVLVIWRAPWSPSIESAIGAMRARGKKVVFDVDDLMVDPNLAKIEIIDGIRSQSLTEEGVQAHYARVRRTMLAADICTAATQELAFHMRWAGKATHVLPNGFDQSKHDISRSAMRAARRVKDGLIRIGYAGGSKTHQRDFGLAVEALACILRENTQCRLVLFRKRESHIPLIDIGDFPCLEPLRDQIEWRYLTPLTELPLELARFDINLAPLDFGNPFCEAKSELKFFEAALVETPTIASPTGPYRRAIEHGKTGFLAATGEDWRVCLDLLVHDPELRARIGREAYHFALAKFGARRRAVQFGCFIDQLAGGSRAARGFALDAHLSTRDINRPKIYPSDVVFEADKGGDAEVSVVVPLYNYESYIIEALESVASQTLAPLDLVVVDDYSADMSLQIVVEWAKERASRFNRVMVLRNKANYGLGLCRNTGFDAALTPYVLLLDADNKIRPACCSTLLAAIKASGAAYVYPTVQHFGASSALISSAPYDPQRFVAGNYIDAMALVSKEAWAMIGGFVHVRFGWEDYDFWCRLAEIGLAGEWRDEILADYRVHSQSMMKVQTTVSDNYSRLRTDFKKRHPWVSLVDTETRRKLPVARGTLIQPNQRTRLDDLLPILRCPVSKHKLSYNETRSALVSHDGLHNYPILEGRPVLVPVQMTPEVHPKDHISNDLPEEALAIIRETKGWVLNLSAGGSREKFEHVVEMEYSIFRHTDIVGDAHALPFDDASFEAIVVMNAFEHYREPTKVVAELLRILKPTGRIHIRTAFLQPLHERPWHFYPCTRHGLEELVKDFQVEVLHVSENFCPSHSLAWIAWELEVALRTDVSPESAERFRAARLGTLVDLWADPGKRDSALWTDFFRISQHKQEITAAGFEFIGRRPLDRPDLSV
jgi:glycosyltransferase involved in cell wall biosynthesis/uncharacterized protein YbaR (Trm112 family)